VAPAEIVRRLGVPRRLVTIVEGENLTNDWTALTVYKFAVAAVVTGSFSLWEAGPEFVLTGVGGVVIGVVAGKLIAAVRRRIDDPPTEITISLLTAYAAYLPAEELGLSGVMAAVTVGVVLGWQASELTTHTTRIQLTAIWEALQFLLNAVLFALVGLQLPVVLDAIEGRSTAELIGYGLLVSALVIAIRLLWVYTLHYLPGWLRGRAGRRDPLLDFGSVSVVAWSGMRGAVALAAALAIPLETSTGAPFPERELVIFLAFCVILATLVGQGLTMPFVIRALGVEDDGLDADEELSARIETAYAAIERLEHVGDDDWVNPDTLDRVRGIYDYRRRRFSSRIDGGSVDGDGTDYESRTAAYRRLMREVIDAQRGRLRELRDRGEITDEVRRRVEYDLDLEEARLES
jgi:CPA1 family monovalent cation:H+ antiporter